MRPGQAGCFSNKAGQDLGCAIRFCVPLGSVAEYFLLLRVSVCFVLDTAAAAAVVQQFDCCLMREKVARRVFRVHLIKIKTNSIIMILRVCECAGDYCSG